MTGFLFGYLESIAYPNVANLRMVDIDFHSEMHRTWLTLYRITPNCVAITAPSTLSPLTTT